MSLSPTASLDSSGVRKQRPFGSSARRLNTFNVIQLADSFKKSFRAGPPAEVPLSPDELNKRRQSVLKAASAELKSYVTQPIAYTVEAFHTSLDRGLTTAEAKERLAQHGKNELAKDPPDPFWKLLLAQFTDLLVILLLIAVLLSAIFGEYPAAIVIFLIVLLNAYLGLSQESKAGKALEALENMTADKASVIRDGRVAEMETTELVPGDLVVLDTGRRIPADLRLVETRNLQSAEMPLTGESDAVPKDAQWVGAKQDEKLPPQSTEEKKEIPEEKKEGKGELAAGKSKKEEQLTEKNMVYMGCTVQDGNGKGIVVKTGMKTKMGEIAALIKSADEEESPLQAKLHQLGKKLAYASIAISVVVLIIGIALGLTNNPLGKETKDVVLEKIMVAVSLTVAAVPEGLPACVTITLAIGMQRMVAKNALIRKLRSVETLGSASVICTDKTGTLTCGIMTAVRLWFAGQVYRITGTGYIPVGDVYPISVKEDDKEGIQRAQRELREQNNPHALPFLIGALGCSSNCVVQEEMVTENNQQVKRWVAYGNTSERSIVVGARKLGFVKETLDKQYPQKAENPFNSMRKTMSVLVDCQRGDPAYFSRLAYVACVKGAPNVILEKCTSLVGPAGVRELTEADRQEITNVIDKFSDSAFRVLAVAYQPFDELPADTTPDALERNLVMCGLIASIDPERVEVKPSIRKAAQAGIRTVMITGDYVKTARAIATNIGILPPNASEDKAVDCEALRVLGDQAAVLEKDLEAKQQAKASREEIGALESGIKAISTKIDALTSHADVYARAKPVDKITIVRSLQRQGHIASMTGDGVNDAPALKQANIGVAMGITGTDVAKAASAMVLLDDNFVSIVEAIEQGRVIYNNIQKFVWYLLSTNISEVFSILISELATSDGSACLETIQILWLNLTTDGAPAIALALEKPEPGIMQEGPRPKTEPIIEKMMIVGCLIQTVFLTGTVLCTYFVGREYFYKESDYKDHDERLMFCRTMCVVSIVFAELFRAYTSRSMRASIFKIGVFSNPTMQWGVGVAVSATFAMIAIPWVSNVVFKVKWMDRWQPWIFTIALTFVPCIVDELTKCVYRMTGFGLRPKAVQPVDVPAHSAGGPGQAPSSSTASAEKSKPVNATKADLGDVELVVKEKVEAKST